MEVNFKEPWSVGARSDHLLFVSDKEGNVIADTIVEIDDARRIVACVNACAGMEDPAVQIEEYRLRAKYGQQMLGLKPEGIVTVFGKPLREIMVLKRDRDDLLAALKLARETILWWMAEHRCCYGQTDSELAAINEAIAKAEAAS